MLVAPILIYMHTISCSLLKEKEIGSMYNVGVTVAEVYNEQIRDLLSQRQVMTNSSSLHVLQSTLIYT